MDNKIIVGFIGEEGAGKSEAASALKELGFTALSIDKKVIEFAVQLLGQESPDEATVQAVREKGYGVNRGYWLNLTLMDVPDDVDYMVIDDLHTNDMLRNVVVPYHIVRSDGLQPDDVIDGATVIFNTSTLGDFKDKVKSIFAPLIDK